MSGKRIEVGTRIFASVVAFHRNPSPEQDGVCPGGLRGRESPPLRDGRHRAHRSPAMVHQRAQPVTRLCRVGTRRAREPRCDAWAPARIVIVFGVDKQTVARRNVLGAEYTKDSTAGPDVRTAHWEMMGSLPVVVFAKRHSAHDAASTALSLAVNYISRGPVRLTGLRNGKNLPHRCCKSLVIAQTVAPVTFNGDMCSVTYTHGDVVLPRPTRHCDTDVPLRQRRRHELEHSEIGWNLSNFTQAEHFSDIYVALLAAVAALPWDVDVTAPVVLTYRRSRSSTATRSSPRKLSVEFRITHKIEYFEKVKTVYNKIYYSRNLSPLKDGFRKSPNGQFRGKGHQCRCEGSSGFQEVLLDDRKIGKSAWISGCKQGVRSNKKTRSNHGTCH